MEATLTFELPEDRVDFECATHGVAWATVVWDMDQWLRGKLKHGHDFKTADEALEVVRRALQETLDGDGLSLEVLL